MLCYCPACTRRLAPAFPRRACHCPSSQPMPAAHLPLPPRCYAIAPEERAALCHKAASYCAKLLKRVDQCQAVLACSHLHWQPEKEVGGWAGEDILWAGEHIGSFLWVQGLLLYGLL